MTPERYQQVTALLDAALELKSADRAAFIGRACADDVELKREVESLLASRAGLLDAPAPESTEYSTVTEVAGAQLGPYRIVGALGEGGMGRVYRAVDTRLGRTVAIKVCKEQFSQRFEREARAIAQLNHPHICQLHDVGPNYLVMDYIEGVPLKGPLPLDQALKYAAQICDALDAAHKKNVTHRDLKPGNILVTKAGVKLLDFGLARVSDADATVTMGVMGTPAYMSPEQWEGKPGDARSDIYAFGCVLYEMADGQEGGARARCDRATHNGARCAHVPGEGPG